MDWQLVIAFHYPHDRFALGFETIQPSEEENFFTFRLFLFIVTIDLNLAKDEE